MKRVFVFGSNLSGIHGAGAAAYAMRHKGAEWGVGIGLQGNSYAIPTKDFHIITLDIETVEGHIADFLDFARQHLMDMEFDVTAIGCGLAGFMPSQIAPLFKDAPLNCILPVSFAEVIDWSGRTWVS